MRKWQFREHTLSGGIQLKECYVMLLWRQKCSDAFVSSGAMEMQPMSRSSITTERDTSTANGRADDLHNPHPGEVLKQEFLSEIRLSRNHLAQAIGVPGNRIHAIVNGMRSHRASFTDQPGLNAIICDILLSPIGVRGELHSSRILSFTIREMVMRTLRTALLAGVAASAIGLSGAALAESPQTHVMTVRLPDGGVEEIRYTGDVPPQIVFAAGPASTDVFAPLPSFFGPGSPFAALDRISAEMDRQAAA